MHRHPVRLKFLFAELSPERRTAPQHRRHPHCEKLTKGEVCASKPGRRSGLSAPEALVIGLRLLGVQEQLPVLHCNYPDTLMQLYALLLQPKACLK